MSRLPGACRHFLIPSLLLPLFGALAWAGLSHVLPLTAALILWPLLALVIGMLAAQQASRSLSHALLPLRNAIDEVRVKGDLGARSGLKGPGVIDTLGTELDNALASLQGIISQVYFNATELAAASLQMAEGAQQICDRSRRQSDTAERTAATLEEMTGSIDLVASHASEASDLAGRASALSGDGSRMVDEAAGEFARIVDSVGDSAAQVRRLGERSQAIGQVVNVIRDIADQTNLLALNAAIEAARAGESGRGFAVVADEVRKLAERTSAATGEIAQTIQAIQHETDTAVSAIGDSASQAAHGAATARSAAEMLERIRRQVEETRQRIASIADATREQAASSRHIVADMSHITEDIQGNHAASQQTLGLAERQARMADNLKEVGVVFKLGRKGEEALRTHAGMPALARQAAEAAGQAFEQALKTGRIDAERLFSLNYTPIPNTEPKKFHTPSDGLADELLPGIQEALLERNGAMVYAIAADRNGYVPTHNQRFSQPLTGDPARDLLLNRTKRIFSDPVGKRVGEHELPYLLQTYRRDTGEIMHDVSAPIYVQGRHWGGFRIGYRTDQV